MKLFKKKEKPIILGQIKNDKLVKFSDSMTWNFDFTLAIFIKTGLERFLKLNNGVPCSAFDEFGNIIYDYSSDMSLEQKAQKWSDVIKKAVHKLDYFLSDSDDDLSKKYKAYQVALDIIKFNIGDFWW